MRAAAGTAHAAAVEILTVLLDDAAKAGARQNDTGDATKGDRGAAGPTSVAAPLGTSSSSAGPSTSSSSTSTAGSTNTTAIEKTLIEKRNIMGWNALVFAACQGNERAMRLLLERGSSVPADALNLASSAGRFGAVALLLKRDAAEGGKAVQVRSPSEAKTALHFAVQGLCIPMSPEDDHAATVHLLVEHGAEVNAQDRRGRTPLLSLLSHPRWQPESPLSECQAALEVVEALLAAGADAALRDENGETVAARAAAMSDDALRKTLWMWGGVA